MRITGQAADEAVIHELGARLRQIRLGRDLTQQQLADEAGISRDTVKRIEAGEDVQLGSLIRILRVLGLLDGLEVVVPEPGPSPVEQVRRQRRVRKRASGTRAREQAEPAPWRWGDEREGNGA